MAIGAAAMGAVRLAQVFGQVARVAGQASRAAGHHTTRMRGLGDSAGRTQDAFEGARQASNALQMGFSAASAGLGLLVTGFTALVGVVRQAAENLQKMGEAARQSGGSAAEIAALAAAGFAPGEIASRAAALARQLATDPQAAMYGQQWGVKDYGGVHGAADQAANLLKLFRTIRDMGPGAEQTRMARMFGMEGDLGRMNVSGPVKAAQDAYAALATTIADADALRGANDISEAWRLVTASWQMLLNAFGKGAFDPITDGLLAFGQALRNIAQHLDQNRAAAETFGSQLKVLMMLLGWLAQNVLLPIITFIGNAAMQLGQWLLRTPMGQGLDFNQMAGMDSLNAALNANTDALTGSTRSNQELTRAFREGMFGGGPRAQNALGKGWQGMFLQELALSGAWRMGVFGL